MLFVGETLTRSYQFSARHEEMYGKSAAPDLSKKSAVRASSSRRQLSDDESEGEATTPAPSASARLSAADSINKPWMREFNLYLDTKEHMPDDLSVIEWWGVSTSFRCAVHRADLVCSIRDIAIQYGSLWQEITSPLWLALCQVNEHSRRLV